MESTGPTTADYLRRVCATAVGPTTLRKMRGVAGHRAKLIGVLEEIDLNLLGSVAFPILLDRWTSEINALWSDQNWGAARKSINLFLRDAAYNFWIRTEFRFDTYESEFEIPLDSRSMQWIYKNGGGQANLKPVSVSDLCPETSKAFQLEAQIIARKFNFHRYDLDLFAWS